MRQSFLTAAGMLGFLALAAPALAQESYLPKGLSRVDLKMVQEAAGNLAPEGPREGSWSNPKNGHSGTVIYVKSTKEKGMNCRLFRYTFVTGHTTDRTPYHLNWCRTTQGNWAIVN
jgi:surface antigen